VPPLCRRCSAAVPPLFRRRSAAVPLFRRCSAVPLFRFLVRAWSCMVLLAHKVSQELSKF
jgi:hypothetical protein